MVLKTQSIAPLETIYEESGSFISSNIDTQQLTNHEYTNETINGLISARSIPSVDIQRQRANENQQKPPIEVRFRDGSKRFIHPSTTAAMIINRRNLLDSSHENLSSKKISNSKYQQIFNINLNKKKFQSKPPLVITIITADDLNQACITPTISSSPDESELSTLTQSQSNSSIDSIEIIKDIQKVPFQGLSTTPVQQIINHSTPNLRSPVRPLQYSQQQQVPTNTLSHSLTMSTQLQPSTSNSKPFVSSFQVTLTNDKNEKNLSLNSNRTNETVNHTVQPNTSVSVGGGTRSAFRPFFKPIHVNQQPLSMKPWVPLNGRSHNPSQHQQIVPYFQFYPQQYSPKSSSSNLKHVSFQLPSTQSNVVAPKSPYDSISATNSSLNVNSLIQMNSSNYQQQSVPVSTNNKIDNSLTFSHIISTNTGQTLSFAINPNTKWFNVTSNSIYDIPRLSTKYPSIPLRITLPMVTPTHNQKLVIKHDIALEKRLLNAGLSPDTVALYERILNIAENQMAILSPPKIIDQYSYQFLK